VISSAIGYGTAAWLTPIATRRISNATWITGLLVAGGVVIGVLGPAFGQVEFIAIGFGLGVTAQGLAICATTILQQAMEDEYRGRVFSVNDMLYNVAFVLGAALSAAFMPDTGRSLPMLLVVACGYVLAAAVYRIMTGQSRPAGPLPAPGSPAPGSPAADWPVGSPDSRAQRSSS
jgi:MFS family permease